MESIALSNEMIVSMAVACIAEELGTDIRNVRVISFREKAKSSLQKFISDHNINYKKYDLEDEL
ncbi:MAG: hypothetical protein IKT14_05705 [Clostridiales bacterium]|nr:hypothetical protein [Clostridiales bacterium]MBR6484496.1 hypothetical protein [Clostridiales bacterium]